jgi:hypothetical protein
MNKVSCLFFLAKLHPNFIVRIFVHLQVIKPEKLLGLDFAFDHHVIVSDYLHAKSNPAAVIRPDWKRSTCFGGSSGFHS